VLPRYPQPRSGGLALCSTRKRVHPATVPRGRGPRMLWWPVVGRLIANLDAPSERSTGRFRGNRQRRRSLADLRPIEKAPSYRGFSRSKPVSRILSRVTIHLGRRLPDGSSDVPGPWAGHLNGTCFALHRTGFGEPPRHRGAGGLLPHLFTLTAGFPEAVSFLCHFPSAFAAWGFPSVLPCGVRTFLGPPERLAVTRPATRSLALRRRVSGARARTSRTPGR